MVLQSVLGASGCVKIILDALRIVGKVGCSKVIRSVRPPCPLQAVSPPSERDLGAELRDVAPQLRHERHGARGPGGGVRALHGGAEGAHGLGGVPRRRLA